MGDAFFAEPDVGDVSGDESEAEAVVALREVFESNGHRVFFSRQLEIHHEHRWFHWVTNRAVRELVAEGLVIQEDHQLSTGTTVKFLWHRGYRYHRREVSSALKLIDEYSAPTLGAAVGLQGELLVLEGFARRGFLLLGRETQTLHEASWTTSAHNVDFIFERDSVVYGVEVKNTLGYMDREELSIKLKLCAHLGVVPVFVVRMMPKTWIWDVVNAGGFVLILKYQLYPVSHRDLARRVAETFHLPVDAPRALQDGTMQRFVTWHDRKRVN